MHLSRQTSFFVTALCYRDWIAKMDVLDEVRKETDDGSTDWKYFHDARLQSAKEDVAEARAARDEMMAYNRTHYPVDV